MEKYSSKPQAAALDAVERLNMWRGDAAGISCEWSGVCVWITSQLDGDGLARVAGCGGRYAQKRGQWYIRACDGLPRRIEDAA